jgi:hypothetical protein
VERTLLFAGLSLIRVFELARILARPLPTSTSKIKVKDGSPPHTLAKN